MLGGVVIVRLLLAFLPATCCRPVLVLA